jgi:ethanolamine utilization protein EutA
VIGIHLREEMGLENAIVSVDGLELKEFDYIDIGSMLPQSGAVPVVIKSLIFPAAARAQRPSDVPGPIQKTISMA